MQLIRFQSGGYVIHRIPFDGKLWSAWYTDTGKLIDCERSGGFYVRSTWIRHQLAVIGKRYAL